MSEVYRGLIGEYIGRKYFLVVRPDPGAIQDPESVKDFAIIVYYRKSGERVQIVRVDTADEGLHIDRLYSQRDDKKKYLDREMTVFEAWEYVQENWKRWAKHEWENENSRS